MLGFLPPIHNLPIRTRLSAILVALIIPLLGLGGILVYEKNKEISFTRKEIIGLELLDHLLPLLQNILTLQAEVVMHALEIDHDHIHFDGNLKKLDQSVKKYIQANHQWSHVIALDQKGLDFWNRPHLTTDRLSQEWKKLKTLLMENPENQNDLHKDAITDFVNLILEHINHVNDASNLLMDMNMDSVYLMENVSYEFPEILGHLAMANKAVINLAHQSDHTNVTPDVRQEMVERIEQFIPILIDSDLEVVVSNNAYAVFADPLFYGPIEGLGARLKKHDSRLAAAIHPVTEQLHKIYEAEAVLDFSTYLAASSNAKEVTLDLWQQQRQDLEAMFHARMFSLWQKIGLYCCICLIAVAISLWLFFWLTRSVTGPLANLEQAMRQVASQQLNIVIPGLDRQDEIGTMAKTVEIFRQNALTLGRLGQSFQAKIEKVYHHILNTIQETNIAAESMTTTAERNSTHAEHLGQSITTTTQNLETSAASSDEMLHSTEAINQQLAHAEDVMGRTRAATEKANAYMQRLQQAAEDIAVAVTHIRKITDMTKLLSMNASIEAVKAGEAGRGFTVVADEVKALANQAAQASNDITERIEQMQTTTTEYFKVMQTVVAAVDEMGQTSGQINHAIAEQRVATGDIAVHMSSISANTGRLRQDLDEILNGTNLTKEIAVEVHKIVKSLSALSFQMEMAMDDYAKELQGIQSPPQA